MSKYIHVSILSVLLILGHGWSAMAQSEPDPVRSAVETLYDVDENGQAFTLSIAALGGAGAIGLGTWLLHERPLAEDGEPAAFLFGNSLILIGTGVGQFVHGFMRLGERQASARTAQALLQGDSVTRGEYLQYLRYRADQSVVTRFVGAVLTTLQGVSTVGAGLELALTEDSQHQTAGWVIAGLGLVSTGIGAVHFFGKTRAERELQGALDEAKIESTASLGVGPGFVLSPEGIAVPGLLASGSF